MPHKMLLDFLQMDASVGQCTRLHNHLPWTRRKRSRYHSRDSCMYAMSSTTNASSSSLNLRALAALNCSTRPLRKKAIGSRSIPALPNCSKIRFSFSIFQCEKVRSTKTSDQGCGWCLVGVINLVDFVR